MEKEFAINAQNVVKRYKKAKEAAVDGIDLQVKHGEVYGFLGPNGAGKSTAIKMFVTTLLPSGGTVEICGLDVMKKPMEIREKIGVVYQEPSLDLKLTAEENLRSHAVLYNMTGFSLTYNWTSEKYKKRVDEVLELVQLQDKKFDIVETFSGGMKRRLDVAKALLHTPDVLFLDEPTTGLDPLSRKTLWQYLIQLQQEQKFTIFLTTHYLEEAEVCDRISIIDQGKILVTDTPDKLKRQVGDELIYLSAVNPKELETELIKENFAFTRDNAGKFVVEKPGMEAQKFLKAIQSELSEINIKRPTLDDVFIKFTGRAIS